MIKKVMKVLKFVCAQKFHQFVYHPNPNLTRNTAYGYICGQRPTLRSLVIVRVRIRVIVLMIYVYNIGFCAVY